MADPWSVVGAVSGVIAAAGVAYQLAGDWRRQAPGLRFTASRSGRPNVRRLHLHVIRPSDLPAWTVTRAEVIWPPGAKLIRREAEVMAADPAAHARRVALDWRTEAQWLHGLEGRGLLFLVLGEKWPPAAIIRLRLVREDGAKRALRLRVSIPPQPDTA